MIYKYLLLLTHMENRYEVFELLGFLEDERLMNEDELYHNVFSLRRLHELGEIKLYEALVNDLKAIEEYKMILSSFY